MGVALLACRLNGRPGSRRFDEVVETSASVVVASKSQDDLANATKLAVVPCGEGELKIQRATRTHGSAETTAHYFGGGAETGSIAISDGVLRIPFSDRSHAGVPLERIEVEIRS